MIRQSIDPQIINILYLFRKLYV